MNIKEKKVVQSINSYFNNPKLEINHLKIPTNLLQTRINANLT